MKEPIVEYEAKGVCNSSLRVIMEFNGGIISRYTVSLAVYRNGNFQNHAILKFYLSRLSAYHQFSKIKNALSLSEVKE